MELWISGQWFCSNLSKSSLELKLWLFCINDMVSPIYCSVRSALLKTFCHWVHSFCWSARILCKTSFMFLWKNLKQKKVNLIIFKKFKPKSIYPPSSDYTWITSVICQKEIPLFAKTKKPTHFYYETGLFWFTEAICLTN